MWLLYVTAARLGGGGMFDQCGYYMSLLQDLVEEACLISVVTICHCCKTWWKGHVWSVWLLYVAAARLGGGGMFDQCGAARLGGGGMFDQCGYYMSLLQDLVEETCLISVVTICHCCKTWWRGHV